MTTWLHWSAGHVTPVYRSIHASVVAVAWTRLPTICSEQLLATAQFVPRSVLSGRLKSSDANCCDNDPPAQSSISASAKLTLAQFVIPGSPDEIFISVTVSLSVPLTFTRNSLPIASSRTVSPTAAVYEPSVTGDPERGYRKRVTRKGQRNAQADR